MPVPVLPTTSASSLIATTTPQSVGADLTAQQILIQSDPSNTQTVYVGNLSSQQPLALLPGDALPFPGAAGTWYVSTLTGTAVVNWEATSAPFGNLELRGITHVPSPLIKVALVDRGGAEFNVCASYGSAAPAVPDARLLTHLSLTTGSNIVTSTTAVFTAQDAQLQRAIVVPAGGAANRVFASTGQITAGTNVLRVTGLNATAVDLNTIIAIAGAGPGGAMLYTHIVGLTDGTDFTSGTAIGDGTRVMLHDVAATTVTNAAVIVRPTTLAAVITRFSSANQVQISLNAAVTITDATALVATDSRPGIDAAIAAATVNGGKVKFPQGWFYYSWVMTGADRVSFEGVSKDMTRVFFADNLASGGISYGNTGTAVLLASDAVEKSRTVSLVAGGGVQWAPGDAVYLKDSNTGTIGAPGSGTNYFNNSGFITRVRASANDVLTLEDAIPATFRTAQTAQAFYYANGRQWGGIQISKLTFAVITPAPTLPATQRIYGVNISAALAPVVEHTRMLNWASGIQLNTCRSGVVQENVVENVAFEEDGLGGFACTGLRFHHNTTINCPFGIAVTSSPYTHYTSNFVGSKTAYSGSGVAYNLAGVAVSATEGRGLKVQAGSHYSSIIGNHISDVGLFGIYVADTYGARVIGNDVYMTGNDTNEMGIAIAGYLISSAQFQSHHCVVSNNVIDGCGGNSIYVNGSITTDGFNTITGNISRAPGNNHIYIASNRNVVSGNILDGGTASIALDLIGGYNTISGNIFNTSCTYSVFSSTGVGHNKLYANLNNAGLMSLATTDDRPFGDDGSLTLSGYKLTMGVNPAGNSDAVVTYGTGGGSGWTAHLFTDLAGTWRQGLASNGYYSGAGVWTYTGTGPTWKGSAAIWFTHDSAMVFSSIADASAAAPTERMRLLSNGNFGVGVVAPTVPFHVAGATIVGAPAAATADANLGNSQLHFWLDETGNNIKFKAKTSGGTVKTGTLAMV